MGDEQRVNLGVSLFIPYRYTEDRIFQALQDAGFDDWTLAQCRMFQRVAPNGSRLTDLAEQAQMTKQSASVMVDQLERLGYVRRILDPTDGRARLIVIEQRGRRAVEVAKATLEEIYAEWKDYLGARDFTDAIIGNHRSTNYARWGVRRASRAPRLRVMSSRSRPYQA